MNIFESQDAFVLRSRNVTLNKKKKIQFDGSIREDFREHPEKTEIVSLVNILNEK